MGSVALRGGQVDTRLVRRGWQEHNVLIGNARFPRGTKETHLTIKVIRGRAEGTRDAFAALLCSILMQRRRTTMTERKFLRVVFIFTALLAVGSLAVGPVDATDVCSGLTCDTVPDSFCDAGGFKVSLTGFIPANTSNNGTATYTYQICSPAAGVCQGGLGTRAGQSCTDNDFCRVKTGPPSNPTFGDPGASCTRECAVNDFHGLSHFDVDFPSLGDTCLSATNFVGGTCTCVPSGGECRVDPNVVLGDPSCTNNDATVAKCDNTNLPVGACIEMSLQVAGELSELGLGKAIVVSKEATDCNESCLSGPSCERCDEPPPPSGECLTRTLGFWGTHPRIADLYDPVAVCRYKIDGQVANTCSTSEALCSSNLDNRANSPYLQLIAQLTAAQLNLNATAALFEGATCSGFTYNGESIQDIIARCDTPTICGGNKNVISDSGCIEALNAFNNSEDTGFDQEQPPFDRPGPADVTQCQLARGNGQAIGPALSCPPAP
jgi:hypothetical protein